MSLHLVEPVNEMTAADYGHIRQALAAQYRQTLAVRIEAARCGINTAFIDTYLQRQGETINRVREWRTW